MQIVIDIPDNYDLSKIQNGSIASKMILNSVANGTTLPKGHGRLIDVDRLESHDEYDGQGFTKSVYKDDIDNLPTIIEADKAESEDKE